jgi:broad specificity phosphatase PhoE
MPRLIAALIRHGDYHQLKNTPSAWQPFSLNKDGKKQALDAAANIHKTLIEQHWQLDQNCDSSQLLRAWQTADIISEKLTQLKSCEDKLNINCFDQLAERGVGSVANLSISTIEEIINNDPRYDQLPNNWKSNSYYKLPFQGAESLMDSGQRVANHIKSTMLNLSNEINKDTLKLFVGHGAAFRHAAFHLNVLEFEQIAKLSMYHGLPIYLERLENNQWVHILGEWKIRGKKSLYTD